MPKQIFKIDSFIGGLNTNSDKQAIEDNELSLSDGIETFNKGRVNLIGQFEEKTYSNPAESAMDYFDSLPGTGLFSFKSDKTNGHVYHLHQHGQVASVIGIGDIGDGIAWIKIGFEPEEDLDTYFPIESITPENAWKGGMIYMRDGAFAGGTATIVSSTYYAGGEGTVTIEYKNQPNDDIIFDGSDGSSLPSAYNNVVLISKNEDVEYFAKVSSEKDLSFVGNPDEQASERNNDDVRFNSVQLFSGQSDGGNIWGPTLTWTEGTPATGETAGYQLGTELVTYPKPAFYNIDGGLRWSDGEGSNLPLEVDNEFISNQSSQFLGYIKTDVQWSDHNNQGSNKPISRLQYNGWWHGPATLVSPRNEIKWGGITLNPNPGIDLSNELGSNALDGEFMICPLWSPTPISGTWGEGGDKYEFHVSYIYKGGGESALTSLGESSPPEGEQTALYLTIGCCADGWFDDPRRVGIKVYYSKYQPLATEYSAVSDKMLLGEFNIEKGFKPATGNSWVSLWALKSAWGQPDITTDAIALGGTLRSAFTFSDPPETSSWESETVAIEGDFENFPRYSTAVVAGRKAYIGNVTIGDKTYGDVILQSKVNSFDSFAFSDRLETARLDGSTIVKLEEYADRLLQFKTDRVDIINIAQADAFIEESFKYKGVTNPGSVCKTDYGIAWVNEFGCYLFDGTQILNLLERNNLQLISSQEWKNFIRQGKTNDSTYDPALGKELKVSPIIGYIPLKRQLLITNSDMLFDTTNSFFYLYNLQTQSWSRTKAGNGGLTASNDGLRRYLSNFVTSDDSGELLLGVMRQHLGGKGTPQLKVFKDKDNQTVDAAIFDLRTKAYDFGLPGVDKKIHKVYFHYKWEGTKVTIKMLSDLVGSSDHTHTFANSSGSEDTTPLSDSLLNDNTEGFKVYNNTAKKVKRIWFVVNGVGLDNNFELYDISVVYRAKSIK